MEGSVSPADQTVDIFDFSYFFFFYALFFSSFPSPSLLFPVADHPPVSYNFFFFFSNFCFHFRNLILIIIIIIIFIIVLRHLVFLVAKIKTRSISLFLTTEGREKNLKFTLVILFFSTLKETVSGSLPDKISMIF